MKYEVILNVLMFFVRVIEIGCNNLYVKYRKYSSIFNVDFFRYFIMNKEI